MKSTTLFWTLVALIATLEVDGFLASATRSSWGVSVVRPSVSLTVAAMKDPRDSDDIPREEKDEEYTGSIDWDAEWKKVMEQEKKGGVDRPGKDFYKSDAELAAIRAANRASTEVEKIGKKLPSAPDMNIRSLSGDWRVSYSSFWVFR